jgi:large subunit ribosomal protein L27
MAHKKSGGSSRNGRDSQGQRLGPKAFAGEGVNGGTILVRQCGNKFWAGENVGQGRDFTLYAKVPGIVQYQERGRRKRRFIDILPVSALETSAN